MISKLSFGVTDEELLKDTQCDAKIELEYYDQGSGIELEYNSDDIYAPCYGIRKKAEGIINMLQNEFFDILNKDGGHKWL